MDLIFATHNQHKLEEIKTLISKKTNLKSLNDIQYFDDIEETGTTFKENAYIKASTINQITNQSIFADDSGLIIEALNGEPGVYSARYAGTGCSIDNCKKVLQKMTGKENRNAYFKSVFCLILEHKTHYFEGEVHGTILTEMTGENGFGYDPIFKPNGFEISFAEMSSQEKNKISHRAIAVQQLNTFLKNIIF